MCTKNIVNHFKWFVLVLVMSTCNLGWAKEPPPNIIIILSDDHAWNDYGFMGHPHVQTPALDQLARDGVTFKKGYVPTSLCRPSLATIITGHYASTIGITGNDPSTKVYGKKGSDTHNIQREKLISKIDSFDTLPKLLKSKGYVSLQTGKWWEGNFTRGGFDEGMTRGFPQKGGRHGDDGLKIGRDGLSTITKFIDNATKQKKPFFVWYAPFMPHTPHTPPDRIYKKYNKLDLPVPVKKYYAMIEWFDETNATLLAHLDEKGIKDNTLIVYVSDNGWLSNPAQLNRFLPKSKQSPGEFGVRTPIIYSWPKMFPPQTRYDLVSSIDIAPTILAAAGLSVPSELPGLNLVDNLTNKTPIERDIIFGEGFAHDIADLDDPEATLLYRWVIKDDWKLILSYDGRNDTYQNMHTMLMGPQLYHLGTDEREETNLVNEYPDIVADLKKELIDWYPVKKRKILTSAVSAKQ